jgi:hypothetical protein
MADLLGFQSFRHNDQVFIVDSDGNTISKPPFATQLVNQYTDRQCIAYDLDLFVACFLKAIDITEDQGKELHEKEHLKIDAWRLSYFPKRFFSIDYGSGYNHPYVNIYNANQQGYLEAKYHNSDLLFEEALSQAKQARDTGLQVQQVLAELGLDTSNIVSPVTPFLKKFALKWPTIADLPIEVTEMSIKAVKGHQFEVYRLGKYDGWDFDVNASYVYHLSYLPEIRNGEFIHVKGNQIPDNAKLGVAEGTLTTEAPLHPFLVDVKAGDKIISMSPIGKFPNVLTLFDIQLMQRYPELGEFDRNEGIYWIPRGSQHQPYKGSMIWLWGQHTNAIGMKRQIVKRIYSSLVGKQEEGLETGKWGKMVCPFIPAHVKSASRIQVVETCLKHKINPVSITGDGFIADSEVIINNSNELGGWKLKQTGRCLSVGSNVILFEQGKHAEDYNNIMEQAKKNPKLDIYAKKWFSPVTLPVALQQGWDDLGNLHRLDRQFSVNSESKRLYPMKPKNCGDLVKKQYDSLPWNYDVLELMTDKIKIYDDEDNE